MKIENKIDQLLSTKMDGFKAEPPASVWDSIQADLQITGATNVVEPSSNTILGAVKSFSTFTKVVLVAGAISVGSMAYYLTNEETVVQPIKENTKETTAASIGLNQKDEAIAKRQVATDKEEQKSQGLAKPFSKVEKATSPIQAVSQEHPVSHSANLYHTEDLAPKEEAPKEQLKVETNAQTKDNFQLNNAVIEVEEPKETTGTILDKTDFTEKRQPKFYNVISPNGDGKNDTWFVEIEEIADYHLSIYNFNGQLVFESDKVNEHWNGANGRTGELCPAGKFAFVLNYKYKNETKMNTDQGLIKLFR